MAVSKTCDDEALEYAEGIINAVHEPLIVLDNDLRVISASRSFYGAFKVKPEETQGRLIYDLGNKQWDIPRLRQLLETLLPRQTILDDYEVEHEFADIGRRIMLLNAREIQRKSGKERLILLAIEDITDRKRQEYLLSDSEERYRRLFETANDGILLLEKAEGKATHANPAIAEMLGCRRDELIGKGLMEIGFPGDIGTIQEITRTLESDGILHYKDATVQTKTGRVIYTDIYMVDKTRLVQCNIRDITERKRAEAERAEQYALIEAIYLNAPLVMMVVDADRRIQQVNRFAAQFAGRPAEEMLGLRSGDALRCLHAVNDPQGCGFGEFCNNCVIRNTVLDTLENGARHLQVEATYDFSLEHKTQSLTLLVSTTPIIFRDENMALVTMMDITEHKQSEQERENLQSQLLQAQKLESVGRLAGGVAHDFNNMLTIINGYAEMMTDVLSPSGQLYDNALQIHEAGKRSAVMVRKLLAFARKQTISPEVMNLNDNVASMLRMLQRLIGENIELDWRPGQNLWRVRMDYSQLDQILANLVVNARDAVADIGKITIETKNVEFDEQYCDTHTGFVPGQFVMLAVSDTGCGMEKEVFDKLFEPFFTTKEIGKGTGLGLSTVYGIVKQNSGFVNVYSEPGQGTIFKIYLPRHEGEAVAFGREDREQYPLGNGETIMVLEDEIPVLILAKTILEKLGYKVLASNSAHEALELVKSLDGAIDLLITDVIMPEMNGRDFTTQVNALYPEIKTLFMSGYTSDVIVSHGILEKGVRYIQKPFSIKDLAIKVRKVIEEQ